MTGTLAGGSGRTLSAASKSKKKNRKKSDVSNSKPKPGLGVHEPNQDSGSGLDELTLVANYLLANGMADIRGSMSTILQSIE